MEKNLNKVKENLKNFQITPRGSGGGANLGKKGLTLKIGDLRKPLIDSFDVLLHELLHFTEIINQKTTTEKLRKLGLKGKKR